MYVLTTRLRLYARACNRIEIGPREQKIFSGKVNIFSLPVVVYTQGLARIVGISFSIVA